MNPRRLPGELTEPLQTRDLGDDLIVGIGKPGYVHIGDKEVDDDIVQPFFNGALHDGCELHNDTDAIKIYRHKVLDEVALRIEAMLLNKSFELRGMERRDCSGGLRLRLADRRGIRLVLGLDIERDTFADTSSGA